MADFAVNLVNTMTKVEQKLQTVWKSTVDGLNTGYDKIGEALINLTAADGLAGGSDSKSSASLFTTPCNILLDNPALLPL